MIKIDNKILLLEKMRVTVLNLSLKQSSRQLEMIFNHQMVHGFILQ